MVIATRQSGCSGCRHRKMRACAMGRPHYPNGGPGVCIDTRKRSGFGAMPFKPPTRPKTATQGQTR